MFCLRTYSQERPLIEHFELIFQQNHQLSLWRVFPFISLKFAQLFVKVRDLPLLVTQGHNNGVNTERREGRERDKERERCFVNNNFSIHSHTLFRCHVIHTHTHLVRAYTYINPCTHTHTFLIRWNVY